MNEHALGVRLAIGGAGLVALVVLMAGAAATGLASFLGGGSPPSAVATAQIPPAMLALYQQAAMTCAGLPWTILAAIGTIESDNGQSTLPGVTAGLNYAGLAAGPMQFEPATFAAYDTPVPPGGVSPPDIYDPTDAVYAAARMLCANGAANGADLDAAIFDYDHDAGYVAQVLALAQSYGETATQTIAASGAGGVAVDWALAQVGTPYIWGGETPGVGFDCSGLAQAAYQVAGITLPRVAQDQFDAGPQLPPGTPLAPGDLVFFGGGAGDVTHVGLFVGMEGGRATMVDAPYAGVDVREDAFPTTVGASWGGGDEFVGATRPAA